MKLDLILRPIANQANLPVYMTTAPKRSARGREDDILLIYLGFTGPNPVPDADLKKWQERLAALFFQSSGSVTNALKVVVEALNKPLFLENDRFEEASTWRTANLCLVVLHHGTLFISQDGKTRAMLIRQNSRTLLFDPTLDSRGLGVTALPKPHFFQSELADGDVLLLSTDFPEAWIPLALTSTDVEALWSRLIQAEAALGPCALVDIRAGQGKVLSGTALSVPVPTAPGEPSQQALLTPDVEEQHPAEVAEEKTSTQSVTEVQPEKLAETSKESSLAEDLFGHLAIAPTVLPEVPDKPEPEVSAEAPEAEIPSQELEKAPEPSLDKDEEEMEAVALPGQPEAVVAAIQPEEAAAESLEPVVRETKPKASIPVEQIKQTAYNGVARSAGWLKKMEDKAALAMGEGSAAPMETVTPAAQLPASVKFLIAILVPIVVVALAAMLFNARGLEDQYQYFLAQAQAAAGNAVQMNTAESQREGWNQTLAWLDKAAAYRVSDEVTTLRARAQAGLDGLDGAVRLVYKPAFDPALYPGLSIQSIIPINNDIYLLDGKSGKVLHMGLKSGTYEQDTSFVCGPGTYEGVSVGALVDVAVIPINNPAKAPILGIDANGNILYCAIGRTPVGVSLIAPAAGWGKIQGISFDSGRLFVMDPINNVVWIYRGFSTQFDREPDSYFGDVPTRLGTAIGLAAGGDELFILYEDGHTSHCLASNVTGELECQDPYLFQDGRQGVPALDFTDLRFSRLSYSPPPDPSIYFLEPTKAELYQFSLRLNLNRILRASGGSALLPSRPVTAFSVSANRVVFLAYENALYSAVLP